MLSNEQIVANLNLTGNFLEASIFSELANSGHFLVTAEWPYSHPAFQGTADIIALNHEGEMGDDPIVIFSIECKKARPDQKVWVFDSARSKNDPLHPFVQFDSKGERVYLDRTGYLLPHLGINRIDDAPLFNKGYELREKDGSLNRNDSERIHAALTQANKALAGVASSGYSKVINVPKSLFDGRRVILIPIVITNAKLKSISYKAEDVDQQTGEILPEAVNVHDHDFVMFDYPLANELQIYGDHKGAMVQPIKRATFVVSADKAQALMMNLCDDAKY